MGKIKKPNEEIFEIMQDCTPTYFDEDLKMDQEQQGNWESGCYMMLDAELGWGDLMRKSPFLEFVITLVTENEYTKHGLHMSNEDSYYENFLSAIKQLRNGDFDDWYPKSEIDKMKEYADHCTELMDLPEGY